MIENKMQRHMPPPANDQFENCKVEGDGVRVRVVDDYLAGWATLTISRDISDPTFNYGAMELDSVEEAEMIIKALQSAIDEGETRD